MDTHQLDRLARISRQLRALQLALSGLGQEGNPDLVFPIEELALDIRADVDALIASAERPALKAAR